jgi:predicted LPLAT superfamily acyltransferase
MSQAWLQQRERGTLFALRLITWITRHAGYRVARALLAPICLYFIVFSGRARRASRDYLARVLGRPPTFADVYRHYQTFATTLLDRVLLLSGRLEDFELDVRGAAEARRLFAQRRGLLLLGSHLGSFELSRVAGLEKAGIQVNVVMHEDNAGKIARWTRENAPGQAPRVIPPGSVDTMLKIREALARGELVAMLGDRPIGRSATLEVPFLGAPARFPLGPIRLARALDVPVLLFFGLYRAPRRYELHLERLELPRDAPAEAWLAAYVARLEAHTRSAPWNWFNFYDFWERS